MRPVPRRFSGLLALACAAALVVPLASAPADAAPSINQPSPNSPEYLLRDLKNIVDAYGRITGPGGQLANPQYLPALIKESTLLSAMQLLTQAASPTRLALNAG